MQKINLSCPWMVNHQLTYFFRTLMHFHLNFTNTFEICRSYLRMFPLCPRTCVLKTKKINHHQVSHSMDIWAYIYISIQSHTQSIWGTRDIGVHLGPVGQLFFSSYLRSLILNILLRVLIVTFCYCEWTKHQIEIFCWHQPPIVHPGFHHMTISGILILPADHTVCISYCVNILFCS